VIAERVSQLLGCRVVSLHQIESRGYAAAYHGVAVLEDGLTVFVKAGTEEVTSGFLRKEIRFYRSFRAPFMPVFHGADDGEPPILVIEDLGRERWPPPWDLNAVGSVRRALEDVAASEPPQWIEPVDRKWLTGGWAQIERDPEPFLATRVRSSEWLETSLPVLRNAAESALVEGDALLHLDVRSDNICLTGRGAVLVDWNQACVGKPELDVAAWLPSLRLEGGPDPEEILTGGGGFAAVLAGFFASRVGLPPPPTAPQVREIQRAQLEVALAWASRELDLRLDQ
jgi:Phosphotransferase enzyme family